MKRVYVAVVHGIGERSQTDWARKSVGELVEYWRTPSASRHVTIADCEPGCELADAPGHRHVQITHGKRTRRVDLDPIYWGHAAERPSRRRTGARAFEATLLIGLIDLYAAAARRRRFGLRWLFSGGGLGILARALVVPLIAPLAFVLGMSCWYGRLGDAFAWATDEASRARIAELVRQRVRAQASAEAIVLVGHSQGGSILASLERELRAERRGVRLLTVGTGHALLSALRLLRAGWPLRRSGILWPPIFLCGAAIALIALIAATTTLPATFLSYLVEIVDWGGSLWQSGVPPVDQTLPIGMRTVPVGPPWWTYDSDMAAWPLRLSGLFTPVAIVTLGCAATVDLAARMIGDRVEVLRAEVQTGADGIDIVASHDPVCAAMLELGEPNRLKRVNQCASLLGDHQSYFKHGCASLPLLAHEIENAAGLRPPPVDADVEAFHRSGLIIRRCTRPWVLLAAVVATGVAGLRLGWPLPVLAGAVIAVVAAAWLAVTCACWRWLHTAKDLAAVPGLAAARERAAQTRRLVPTPRRRPTRTQLAQLAGLVTAGVILLGGLDVVTSTAAVRVTTTRVTVTPAGIRHLTEWEWLSLLASVVGAALLVSTWFSVFGLQWAMRCCALFVIGGGLLWIAQGTTAPAVVGIGWLAFGAWTLRRSWAAE